jgi:hypothetical protein
MSQNLNFRFLLFYCLFIKKKILSAPFCFFVLVFYCLSLFQFSFLSPFVSPFLLVLVLFLFLAHVVSSLAYPNLSGTKRLGCCCCNEPLSVPNFMSQFHRIATTLNFCMGCAQMMGFGVGDENEDPQSTFIWLSLCWKRPQHFMGMKGI